MKIKVMDIPEEGLDIRALAQDDRWFLDVIKEAFQEDYQKGSAASLDLHLMKTCDNISATGSVVIDLTPSCARCLESFKKRTTVPLHVDLAPLKEAGIEEGEELELGSGDLNFAFYKGEEINLGEIVREMLMLEIPLRYLCKEACRGLCTHCGQDLNEATCGCAPAHGDSRFAVLKSLLKTTE